MTTPVLPDYAAPFKPVPNVTPFTIRDGVTMLKKIDYINKYIDRVLIPWINENFSDLADEFETQVNALLLQVNAALSEQTANNNAAIAEVEQSLAELTTYLNDQVDAIIGSSIEVSGPVVEGILANPASASRVLLATLFANKATETFVNANLSLNQVKRSVNPMSYGAVGDGVADDSTPVLNAIAAANGGDVFLPEGKKFKAAVSLTNEDVRIIGPGKLVQFNGQPVIRIAPTWDDPIACASSIVNIGALSTPAKFTRVDLASNDYRNIYQGDLYRIESEDIYAWSVQALGAGATIWQAEFLPVFGIALSVTGIGAIFPSERNTVTGQTSGATAIVQSFAKETTDSGVVMVGGITTNFISGEVLVNSSNQAIGIAGSTYIVSNKVICDSYLTNAKLRKVKKTRVEIRTTVETVSNMDNILLAAGRGPAAIDLIGVYKPFVDVTVYGAYSSAVRYQSCYYPVANVRADKLPNIASSTESGYGYAVEIAGATEGGDFVIHATNIRHAFTTNVTSGTLGANAWWGWGTVKYNTVHDSVSSGAIAAGFDTHEGAYFTTFINCRSISNNAGSRFQSTGVGFNNRGFGTRYISCIAEDCNVGFNESGALLTTALVYETVYKDCIVENFLEAGYKQGTDAAGTNSTIRIDGCTFIGADASPLTQSGMIVRGGRNDIINTRVTNLGNNGKGIWALGTGNRLYIDGFTLDCNRGTGTQYSVYVQGTMALLVIALMTIRSGSAGLVPAYWFRNQSGDSEYRVDRLRAPGLAPTTGTLQITAGTPTLVNVSRTIF